MARASVFSVVFAIAALSGCHRPGPGLDLVDGCYYSRNRAVLRVAGTHAKLLIPGDVSDLSVATSKTKDVSEAVFGPAFILQSPEDLKAIRQKGLREGYYMMDPYSDVPTILVPTNAKRLVSLKLGAFC